MTSIKKYVIRHKPTGWFIPVPRNGSRGGTFVEPSMYTNRMRLFPSLRSATSFLAIWLKGYHEGEHSDGYSYVGNIRHIPSRIKKEMEIVPAYVIIDD